MIPTVENKTEKTLDNELETGSPVSAVQKNHGGRGGWCALSGLCNAQPPPHHMMNLNHFGTETKTMTVRNTHPHEAIARVIVRM